jgi:hypothetical protein
MQNNSGKVRSVLATRRTGTFWEPLESLVASAPSGGWSLEPSGKKKRHIWEMASRPHNASP